MGNAAVDEDRGKKGGGVGRAEGGCGRGSVGEDLMDGLMGNGG